FRQCVELRNRLFSGIEFRTFTLNARHSCSSSVMPLEFVREFTRKFIIENLQFYHVDSSEKLELFLKIMSEFPKGKVMLALSKYLPDDDALRALPAVESLSIVDHFTPGDDVDLLNEIEASLFFNLLGKSQFLVLINVVITAGDFQRIVEICAADQEKRTVHIRLRNSVVAHWLKGHHISQA
ncbi:hypothetical protein PMAYCL1PPCAC_31701, partial [Pristionchus mayeri]